MSVYRLPHGQYGYSGHVINLPQDVSSFVNSLPRLPSDLDVIVVRKEGANHTHRDFRVRRSVFHDALQWLIVHNRYYRANNVRINIDALDELPEDGNLSELPAITVESLGTEAATNSTNNTPTTSSPSTTDDTTEADDPYNAHLIQSFVPIATQSLTEQEAVQQSVREREYTSSPATMMWPSIGGVPINEFTTEGYISCAFPTLFPTGAGDFSGQRQNKVTIGNYFRHLMMYDDSRFAKHPRFRFFALNTEMRWRALQTGQVYIKQHPGDAQLSLNELRDMVGRQGDAFSKRVVHFASSLRGTKQYWFRQRSRLLSMVDTLGLPTIFFTHSAADLQWPELAKLICPHDPDSRSSRSKAVIENPAISDWFFYYRIMEFIKAYYTGVLGVSDYWMRFEWQHRGSPHVHGLAWLPAAPNVEQLLSSPGNTPTAVKEAIVKNADCLVSTINPGVLPDGSNVNDAPAPKTDPHICNKSYQDVQDFDEHLADLVATCQRHTRCSAAYCLRTRNGRQECRFGYPKPLQPESTIVMEEEPTLLTARNDGMVNSYNPVQLSAWRANVDMQYIVSRRRVLEYCTKYVTKSEPKSQSLREVYTTIVRSLQECSTSLKAVQKLLMNTVGERDYSTQETCHLLQLPMFKASRDFIVLSLDGSRAVENHLEEDQRATALSIIDQYMHRPTTPPFNDITLIEFARQYSMPKTLGSHPTRRSRCIVVIPRPYCSPDPAGPKYEQYCCQSLMQHKCFRQMDDLLAGSETYIEAYAEFLQSGHIPPCLEDDMHRLLQHTSEETDESSQQQVQSFCNLTSFFYAYVTVPHFHCFSPPPG